MSRLSEEAIKSSCKPKERVLKSDIRRKLCWDPFTRLVVKFNLKVSITQFSRDTFGKILIQNVKNFNYWKNLKRKDPATDGFVFQQTMLRVKDIAKSLEFYTDILGMQLIADFHFEQWKFSVYFLAYVKPENIPDDPTAKMAFLWNQPACLELTHNHG